MSNWTKVIAKEIPQQKNKTDCGVFVCTYAEHISRRARFKFRQEDMPKIRMKMALECIEKKLLKM